ncbi:glycoside hydrolase family 95 protein [Sphingomonas sp. RS2018]
MLWYAQPAATWVEALPVGNGRISAMVHGGTDSEYLQLNEDTLWAGGPYDPANPTALAALPEVRQMVFDGRYAEAAERTKERLMGTPMRQSPYATMGSLVIDRAGFRGVPPGRSPTGTSSPVTPLEAATPLPGYRRELDLDGAIATTRWEKDGVIYRREVFASAPDQVIVVRLSASSPGHIDVDLSLAKPTERSQVSTPRHDELLLVGRNEPANGTEGALLYETRARAIPIGGTVERVDDQLRVRSANELTVLVAMATSYRRFDDVSGDPAAKTIAQIAKAVAVGTAAKLVARHQADHRALFRRVSLDLGRTPAADLPTDQRVRSGETGQDTALATLYFNYARYMLIACSRPGSQPANLQGIWNDTNRPPWGGKYTININTEMNYWPAEITGLPECVEPLVQMVKEIAITGARTARVMYGARGWVCHHNTDLWRATAPIDGPNYGMWPMGGAWLCTHLWDRYDYGRDRAYLQSIYPVLHGAALFFIDVLQKDPKSGFLVTNPSISPELSHGHGSALCAGPTMDMAILRDLFDQAAQAATILGRDAAFVRTLRQTREQLAPYKVGAQGQLQEWQEDWDADAPQHHRHVSHLYGVYPGHQISTEGTPRLADAAKRSLDLRGDEATGWATAWRIALWARLRDGNRAYDILRFLIGPKRTYPNMFDAHPPFQIDGNFGGAAAITEMLMSGAEDKILLLPALPDAWPDGAVRGLRARGGVEIDITWRGKRLTEARLSSKIDGKRTISHAGVTRSVMLRANRAIKLTGEDLRVS